MKLCPQLRRLSAEHARWLAELARPTSADGGGERLLALWDAEIQPHCRAEEKVLLPDLARRLSEADAVIVFTTGDHLVLRSLVRDLRDATGQDAAVAAAALARKLAEHFHFEERTLFPALQETLGCDRLAELQGELSEAGTLGASLGGALLGATPALAEEKATTRWPGTKVGEPTPKVKGVPAELARNLAKFDDLDFRVYTGQQWQDFHKTHTKDVVVHWPDGHTTKGLDVHIEDLKVMFTFAPDNRIKEHPARFGTADGEWTAVTGWLEGTFTKPMAIGDGKFIEPTGKAYRIPMATIGHWNKDGIMFEEFLFWDNGEFMKQIGLAK